MLTLVSVLGANRLLLRVCILQFVACRALVVAIHFVLVGVRGPTCVVTLGWAD